MNFDFDFDIGIRMGLGHGENSLNTFGNMTHPTGPLCHEKKENLSEFQNSRCKCALVQIL